MFPVLVGGVVPIYNIKSSGVPGKPRLKLRLVSNFQGKHMWDDERILETNEFEFSGQDYQCCGEERSIGDNRNLEDCFMPFRPRFRCTDRR